MNELSAPLMKIGFILLLVVIGLFLSSRDYSAVNGKADSSMRAWEKKLVLIGYDYSREAITRIVIMFVVVMSIAGMIVSPMMMVCLPAIGLCVAAVYIEYASRSAAKSLQLKNDDVCYLIARQLRAGYPLEQCVVNATEVWEHIPYLQQMKSMMNAGLSLRAVVERMSGENQLLSADEKALTATLALSHTMGGSSAHIFDRMGDIFHRNYELQADTGAALAQVRISAYVISGLPVFMLGLSLLMGSDAAMYLFTKPLGWGCLVFGGVLEYAGIMWMRSMVRKGVEIWTS